MKDKINGYGYYLMPSMIKAMQIILQLTISETTMRK